MAVDVDAVKMVVALHLGMALLSCWAAWWLYQLQQRLTSMTKIARQLEQQLYQFLDTTPTTLQQQQRAIAQLNQRYQHWRQQWQQMKTLWRLLTFSRQFWRWHRRRV